MIDTALFKLIGALALLWGANGNQGLARVEFDSVGRVVTRDSWSARDHSTWDAKARPNLPGPRPMSGWEVNVVC